MKTFACPRPERGLRAHIFRRSPFYRHGPDSRGDALLNTRAEGLPSAGLQRQDDKLLLTTGVDAGGTGISARGNVK
jgi:hypothetical protein